MMSLSCITWWILHSLVEQLGGQFFMKFLSCFTGINATSGTKTAKLVSLKSGKLQLKMRNSINPHASSLLRRLMDFEWLRV